MTRSVFADMLDFTVDSRGAQLVSLVRNNTEVICSGTRFWNYSAPTLFPIVGRLKDDTFRFDGKSYSLRQHGFARNRDFMCIDDQPLTYRTAYDDDTLKLFPFKFALTVSFRPLANELLITTRVHNLDEVTMWFSVGAHPALRLFEGGTLSDYCLAFEREESASRIILKDGLFSKERRSLLGGRTLPLCYDLFKDDALIFDDLKSSTIELRRDNKSVSVRSENCPFWGIWTKQDAPFLCIEPWHGHADFTDFSGSLPEKAGIISLEPGKSFSSQYSIIVDV